MHSQVQYLNTNNFGVNNQANFCETKKHHWDKEAWYLSINIFTEILQDSYQLAVELEKAWVESSKTGTPVDVVSSLKR